jgi:hypothetical protein
LHRRYSNIDFILAMDLEEAGDYIRFVMEKDLDDKLFTRWLSYQSEIGFEEFKDKIKALNEPEKTEEEILTDVEIILEQFTRSKHASD